MDTSDVFYLKWDEFADNFKLNCKELRKEEDFCDVTLVSDDGKHIEAHKIVLATSSTVFKDILKKNKQVHPLLYLRGIESNALAPVLDFIYHGEVKVPQADLDDFLDVARDLGVKGLMNRLDLPESSTKKKKVKRKRQGSSESLKKPKIEDPYDFDTTVPFQFDFINDNIKFEDIMGEIQEKSFDHEEVITSIVNVDGENLSYTVMNNSVPMDELNTRIEEMIFVENGCWGCKKCGKVMKKKQHIKNHAESHLEGYSHPCPYCGKSSKTRNALTNHISYFHKHPMSKKPLALV